MTIDAAPLATLRHLGEGASPLMAALRVLSILVARSHHRLFGIIKPLSVVLQFGGVNTRVFTLLNHVDLTTSRRAALELVARLVKSTSTTAVAAVVGVDPFFVMSDNVNLHVRITSQRLDYTVAALLVSRDPIVRQLYDAAALAERARVSSDPSIAECAASAWQSVKAQLASVVSRVRTCLVNVPDERPAVGDVAIVASVDVMPSMVDVQRLQSRLVEHVAYVLIV